MLITCSLYSTALNMNTKVNVLIPEIFEGKLPTLYLLHGYQGSCDDWIHKTQIELFARKHRLAVVMPSAANSFYSNFHGVDTGYRYWDYVSDELITLTRRLFPLSDKREDTFVAGYSMGGFGAFKLALNRPEMFSVAASFSGVMDLAGYFETVPDRLPEINMISGSPANIKSSDADLFALASKAEMLSLRPRLLQYCGTEDFLYPWNVKFRDFIKNMNFDYTYKETPGGHDYMLWSRWAEEVVDSLMEGR